MVLYPVIGVACTCRHYMPSLKQLLKFTLLPHQNHHRQHRQLSFSSCFNWPENLNRLLLTGHSFFRPMEGDLCAVLWTSCILVTSFLGACCTLFNGDNQTHTCPVVLDPQIEFIDSAKMEAMHEETSSFLTERYWAGSDINKNKTMVEHLEHYGVVRSKKVAEVMENIDRALFVPDGNPPYVDSPMAIGYNATISAPHMHATCLQLLEDKLQPGMHALDVGSGTGYLTACFAMMVGPQGHAVGVEHIPELVASSISNIEKSAAAALLKGGCLSVHAGDGRQGWPEFAPYDAIHVGAAAPEIPQPLIDQLKPGGRMVIPVGNVFQELKVIDKGLDGSASVRTETSVRYVPLTSREAQLHG